MRELANQLYQHAERLLGRVAKPLAGIVRSYDPAHYAVKVEVQPEGFLTGWVPLDTPFIGMYAPPEIGEVVDIEFEQGDIETGRVKGVRYGGYSVPQACPAGERWFVHLRTGTLIKMHNDGSLEVHAAQNLNLTVAGDANITVQGQTNIVSTGNVNITAPTVAVTGNITATGDIIDHVTTKNQSMAQQRAIYDSHVHPASGGTTGVPIQQE